MSRRSFQEKMFQPCCTLFWAALLLAIFASYTDAAELLWIKDTPRYSELVCTQGGAIIAVLADPQEPISGKSAILGSQLLELSMYSNTGDLLWSEPLARAPHFVSWETTSSLHRTDAFSVAFHFFNELDEGILSFDESLFAEFYSSGRSFFSVRQTALSNFLPIRMTYTGRCVAEEASFGRDIPFGWRWVSAEGEPKMAYKRLPGRTSADNIHADEINFETTSSESEFARVAMFDGDAFIPLLSVDTPAGPLLRSVRQVGADRFLGFGFYNEDATWTHRLESEPANVTLRGTGLLSRALHSATNLYILSFSAATGTIESATIENIDVPQSDLRYDFSTTSRDGGLGCVSFLVQNDSQLYTSTGGNELQEVPGETGLFVALFDSAGSIINAEIMIEGDIQSCTIAPVDRETLCISGLVGSGSAYYRMGDGSKQVLSVQPNSTFLSLWKLDEDRDFASENDE